MSLSLRVLYSFIALFMITFFFSMAGMTISAWLVTVTMLVISFRKKTPFQAPPKLLLISLGGLFLSVLISLLINYSPEMQFTKMLGKTRWMFLLIGFYHMFYHFFEPERFHKHLKWVLPFIYLVCAYCLYQFLTGHDFFHKSSQVLHQINHGTPLYRPIGFFGLTLTLAYSLGMFSAFLSGYTTAFRHQMKNRDKALFISVALLLFISSFLAFTRGAWLAVGVSFLCMAFFYKRSFFIKFAALFVVLIVSAYGLSKEVRTRTDSVFSTQFLENYQRIDIWKANILMFKEHPIFGIGYGENERRGLEYMIRIGKPDAYYGHAHNSYLDYLSGTGLVGLYFFVVFLVLNFRYSYRAFKIYQARQQTLESGICLGSMGLQLVLLVGSITESAFKDSELNYQYIFVTGLSLALYMRATTQPKRL